MSNAGKPSKRSLDDIIKKAQIPPIQLELQELRNRVNMLERLQTTFSVVLTALLMRLEKEGELSEPVNKNYETGELSYWLPFEFVKMSEGSKINISAQAEGEPGAMISIIPGKASSEDGEEAPEG